MQGPANRDCAAPNERPTSLTYVSSRTVGAWVAAQPMYLGNLFAGIGRWDVRSPPSGYSPYRTPRRRQAGPEWTACRPTIPGRDSGACGRSLSAYLTQATIPPSPGGARLRSAGKHALPRVRAAESVRDIPPSDGSESDLSYNSKSSTWFTNKAQ